MHGVLFALEAPTDWWCTRLSRPFPRLEIRFLQVVPVAPGRCLDTVRLCGEDTPDAVAWLEEQRLERRVVLWRERDAALLRFHVQDSFLARILFETEAVPQFPFSVRDGEIRWLLLGDEERARSLLAWCRRNGLRVRTLRSGGWHTARGGLTPHQRDVLGTAVAKGYYDHPRRITLTGLAAERGVSKSTMSETLMVIEHKIMRAHFDGTGELTIRPVGRAVH